MIARKTTKKENEMIAGPDGRSMALFLCHALPPARCSDNDQKDVLLALLAQSQLFFLLLYLLPGLIRVVLRHRTCNFLGFLS